MQVTLHVSKKNMPAKAHRRRIAIIGSGLSAYGVCSSLIDEKNLDIDIFDIGLSSKSTHVSSKPPPNSIPSSNSYYPYGFNDTQNPLKLYSQRLCSSHAFGGFSTVYSGSVLLPSAADFSDWPLAAIPSNNQIATTLANLSFNPPAPTPLSLRCSHPYPDNKPYINIRRSSFVVAPLSSSVIEPFRASDYFSSLRETGKVFYTGDIYVTRLGPSSQGIQIFGKERSSSLAHASANIYDAVFLCAGCINSTLIVSRSLPPKPRTYPLQVCPMMLLPVLSFGSWSAPADIQRRDSAMPLIFVENSLNSDGSSNVHTQLGFLKHQMTNRLITVVELVIRRLGFSSFSFFYSLSVFHSNLQEPSILHYDPANDSFAIREAPCKVSCSNWLKVYFSLLLSLWKYRCIPLPLPPSFAKLFTKTRLGGWHYGCSIPISCEPHALGLSADINGQVSGLPGVFAADSTSFPSIPGSTVALLTISHASRIARAWAAAYL